MILTFNDFNLQTLEKYDTSTTYMRLKIFYLNFTRRVSANLVSPSYVARNSHICTCENDRRIAIVVERGRDQSRIAKSLASRCSDGRARR